MIGVAAKLSRAATTAARTTGLGLISHGPPSPPFRLFCANNGSNPNPVALQMINYALSLARSRKSDESYAQASLVLEQCLSTQHDENSKGMVLLAMSSLLSERGNIDEAIEKLQRIQDLNFSSIGVRVAATEALVGLHLELGQDDASSVLADICLQLLDTIKLEIGGGCGTGVLDARVKALKGLVELLHGNLESAESLFQGAQENKDCSGNVALSYGEFLHASQNLSMAKELYEKVIQGVSKNKDFSDLYNLAACNMALEEVLLAATCALGQVEAHLGNFGDAEEILTRALTKAEQHFGSHHPKVGVVLTCIALMFRQKAMMERSSSLLIQEGLYRRAIDLLKAPPLETEGAETNVYRRDIVTLARGGYAETLCIQQNRKAEGERMKSWAESVWRNRRLSLAEALDISESSSKVPVIDARISRVV
uniref:MalT-like TPR region domain-containing protein n=1 Tax=Davidia involucrata TaxID=16924 RepID=A0A5B6YNM5_DAVIN